MPHLVTFSPVFRLQRRHSDQYIINNYQYLINKYQY